jgi:enoyl-CoA hydratase
VLTLNRPEARNALSRALTEALHQALLDADQEERVRVLVLTGTDPAFCAGIDLKEAAREGDEFFQKAGTADCIAQVGRMSKPVIGAINGATFTGGLELALGCDFLIASQRAGQVIDSATAQQIGLVTDVVPHDQLMPRALDCARAIAEVPPDTVRGLKQMYDTRAQIAGGQA